MDTKPTIAAIRRPIAALRRLASLPSRHRTSSTRTNFANGLLIRFLAALLVTMAAFSDPHVGQPDPAAQVKVAMTSPAMSGADLLALAAGTVEVVDDGIDIHLALRGQPAVAHVAEASPMARPYADPVALTGPWLPERPPPRVA